MSYDQKYLEKAEVSEQVHWRFQEFGLGTETALAAEGAQAVWIFVNDEVNRECLEILATQDVKLITLRYADFNNVDMVAALKPEYIGGVGLDVYEQEDVFFEDRSRQVPQDNERFQLLMFPNVLITSQQAFFTHEALSEISRVPPQNLPNFETHRPFLDETTLYVGVS